MAGAASAEEAGGGSVRQKSDRTRTVTMPGWGALLVPRESYEQIVELAQALEGWGFSSFWCADEKYYKDCYIGLALVASQTVRMRLGPCVTDPYSRHPIQTAVSIASLTDIAPGRVCLGLGAGGRGLAETGIVPRRPAVALKEAIEILRALLRGETVDFQGQVISLKERALDFRPRSEIPIMVATGHGKRIQELAGELADIAMVANYATPATISAAVRRVERGAERAGRSLKDLQLIARVDVAVSQDGSQARRAVAPRILSAFRASYPDLGYLEDLPHFALSSEFLAALNAKDYASKAYYADPDHSAGLIPDILTDHMAIAGTPEEVATKLRDISKMNLFGEVALCAAPCKSQTLFEAFELLAHDVIPKV